MNIAILSARENFEKRQTIRDTWLKDVAKVNQLSLPYNVLFNVNAHFVLGNNACSIHPLNRENIFDCIPKYSLQTNHLSSEYRNKDFSLFSLKSSIDKRFTTDVYLGFSFKVGHMFFFFF